jgi:hypothetical protein
MKSSQIERAERRKLAGSTNAATTYRDLAEAGIVLESQGRFADKASVVGAAKVPQYPAASGPWNDPVQVPDEPPLGYTIDAQEAVGEPTEIAASLAASSTGTDDAAAPEVLSIPPQATSVIAMSCHPSDDAPAPSALFPLAAEGAPSNVIAAHPPEPEAPVHARVGVDDAAPLVNDADASGATLQLRRGRRL